MNYQRYHDFALEALWEQVPRSQSGWVQKGKELDPESVNFCATFKAPQLKYLLLWRGDKDVANNCVMSCPQYEKMTGESAFRMCARSRERGCSTGGSKVEKVVQMFFSTPPRIPKCRRERHENGRWRGIGYTT